MPAVLLIVVFLIAVITLAVYAARQAKKRREALRAWAQAHGLHYDDSRDHSFDERFTEFNCLQQGAHRYAYNIIDGELEGRRVLSFDYHYETYSTDSKGNRTTNHHVFSAVILRAKLPLRPLVIRAESIFDRMAGFFGFDDIDFESAEFSKRFFVKSPDRRWAYDVIHQRTMQFLLDSPRFSIEFDSRNVIAWRGSRFDVAALEAAIGVIDGILDRLPDYVVQQQTQGQ